MKSEKKPFYKRWRVYAYSFAAIVLFGWILDVTGWSDANDAKLAEENAIKVQAVEAEVAASAKAKAISVAKADDATKAEAAAKEKLARAQIESNLGLIEEDAKTASKKKAQSGGKVIIKKSQIESMFKRDPDEKVFEDSSFITKDGLLTADYIMYVGDETVPYVSAIFYGGDLANITLETKLSNDEIEKLLDVTFSEETRKGITRRATNVEINFDKRFADEKIINYPFELD